jgi:putative PIN family toxin of toxin-antitoxin system
MPRVVLDTTILVSAFLRAVPGGAAFDLLQRAHERIYDLVLSDGILTETKHVLERTRLRDRYGYVDAAILQYHNDLSQLATVVQNVPDIRVVRDPNDDMILACAIAGGADYLVSRDDDLLSLHNYDGIEIVTPEEFLRVLRERA